MSDWTGTDRRQCIRAGQDILRYGNLGRLTLRPRQAVDETLKGQPGLEATVAAPSRGIDTPADPAARSVGITFPLSRTAEGPGKSCCLARGSNSGWGLRSGCQPGSGNRSESGWHVADGSPGSRDPGSGASCLLRYSPDCRRYQLAGGTPAALEAARVPIRGARTAIASSVTAFTSARCSAPSEIVSKLKI
jgi:hypothetical protein